MNDPITFVSLKAEEYVIPRRVLVTENSYVEHEAEAALCKLIPQKSRKVMKRLTSHLFYDNLLSELPLFVSVRKSHCC